MDRQAHTQTDKMTLIHKWVTYIQAALEAHSDKQAGWYRWRISTRTQSLCQAVHSFAGIGKTCKTHTCTEKKIPWGYSTQSTVQLTKQAQTYVLLAHYVVERELWAPRALVEGGAAGAAVGWAGGLLHDVLRQREQALLRLLDQVSLDVVAA